MFGRVLLAVVVAVAVAPATSKSHDRVVYPADGGLSRPIIPKKVVTSTPGPKTNDDIEDNEDVYISNHHNEKHIFREKPENPDNIKLGRNPATSESASISLANDEQTSGKNKQIENSNKTPVYDRKPQYDGDYIPDQGKQTHIDNSYNSDTGNLASKPDNNFKPNSIGSISPNGGESEVNYGSNIQRPSNVASYPDNNQSPPPAQDKFQGPQKTSQNTQQAGLEGSQSIYGTNSDNAVQKLNYKPQEYVSSSNLNNAGSRESLIPSIQYPANYDGQHTSNSNGQQTPNFNEKFVPGLNGQYTTGSNDAQHTITSNNGQFNTNKNEQYGTNSNGQYITSANDAQHPVNSNNEQYGTNSNAQYTTNSNDAQHSVNSNNEPYNANTNQQYQPNSNGQYTINSNDAQHTPNSNNGQYDSNKNDQLRPNSNGQYTSNSNDAQHTPNSNNGQYDSNENNQYRPNSNGQYATNSNDAQHTVNSNNEQNNANTNEQYQSNSNGQYTTNSNDAQHTPNSNNAQYDFNKNDQYKPNSNGQYTTNTNDAQHITNSNNGQYNSNTNEQHTSDSSGQYSPDSSGQYSPSLNEQYTPQVNQQAQITENHKRPQINYNPDTNQDIHKKKPEETITQKVPSKPQDYDHNNNKQEEPKPSEEEEIIRYDGSQLWKIPIDEKFKIRVVNRLASHHTITTWGGNRSFVDALVMPENLANVSDILVKSGIPYEVIIEDLQKSIEEENPPLDEEQMELQNRKGHRMTWIQYHRLKDIHEYLDYLANTYPNICSVQSIGTSYQGRQLKLLKISSGRPHNKAAFIDGGIHAREWIAPATVTYIINHIVENFDNGPDIYRNLDWYFVPVVNPDGYEYTHTTNRLWRKSRSGVGFCAGVDLNRNFGYKWGGKGTNNSPCNEVYRGPKAFSEPETRAMRDFLTGTKADFKLYVSYHSYGQFLLYPWGYDEVVPPDYKDLEYAAQRAAQAMRKAGGTEYTVGTSSIVLYPAAGGSDDWAKAVPGIKYSYTIELPDTGKHGFILPASYILSVGKVSMEGLIQLAETAAKA